VATAALLERATRLEKAAVARLLSLVEREDEAARRRRRAG
jgi:hypothetical protein